MSPLRSYGRLVRLAGPAYVVVAFLGRLPLAMSQLGTLLLVAGATDSYGLGGLAAGSLAVANAVGAPVAGAVADRSGQRPVVLLQSLAGAVALVALVLATRADADPAALVGLAALAGLVLPQVGPLARVRWRPVTAGTGADQRRLVDAAFSYEGAADEASFVLGPALVGAVAVAVSPGGSLVVAAGLLAVFGTAFALHRTASLTGGASRGATGGRLVTGVFLTLMAAQALIGTVFGSVQTGATALATAAGQPGAAGMIHATLGVGSVFAGLATAYLPEHVGHDRRVRWAAAGLLVLSLPLLLVSSVPTGVAAVALLGLAVAPYMIAVFSLGERIVPPARVGAAMTLLAAATGVGYAAGSGTAGRLADLAPVGAGHTAAFTVTVTATTLALTLAVACRRRWARALAPAPAASRESQVSPAGW
ncbi:MFS transporter [Nocardioides sp. CFH 31398]|uniref:MFS transporter n=1 Tax=Nocardioides sp. CFH 31398 TaxID=2919579 RepID=UPI001F06F081|nr:MFS transporter [Nocardioides sp. CFH 31398]MCH1865337.1 MFS transporter [Nocardioides sp. CFH 31398]